MNTFHPPQHSVSEDGLLLDEFMHRSNNEMAAAISAISVASRHSPNAESRLVLNTVKSRLESYALLQHTLRRPQYDTLIDASVYFRQLCQAIRDSRLAPTGITLEFVDRPCAMQSVLCWRLALVAYELICNAARHAFQNGMGRIRLEMRVNGTMTECRVTDNGVGSPDILPGFGLSIVNAVATGIGGSLRHYSGPHGTTWLVNVPEVQPGAFMDGPT